MVFVGEELLPKFSCQASKTPAWAEGGEAPSSSPQLLSCAVAEDDFCDCEGDGGDETFSSACASVSGSQFWCGSGALEVSGGSLLPTSTLLPTELAGVDSNFISSTKVGDGVWDCSKGEDEHPHPLTSIF